MVRRYVGGHGATHYGYMARLARRRAGAAVRLQATARGLMARRAVRAVRAAERDAEGAAAAIVSGCGGGGGDRDRRARAFVSEELMRILLRLDAVRGARAYRKRVVARVVALQDAVDAAGAGGVPPSAPARPARSRSFGL